jgi:hypothetical protein
MTTPPLPNPAHPLSVVEKLIFGEDGARHSVTGMCLETGFGSLSPADQARLLHIPQIETIHGRVIANEFRRKLGIPIAEEVEAEQARLESAREERLQRAYAALEKEEAEAKAQSPHPLSSLH